MANLLLPFQEPGRWCIPRRQRPGPAMSGAKQSARFPVSCSPCAATDPTGSPDSATACRGPGARSLPTGRTVRCRGVPPHARLGRYMQHTAHPKRAPIRMTAVGTLPGRAIRRQHTGPCPHPAGRRLRDRGRPRGRHRRPAGKTRFARRPPFRGNGTDPATAGARGEAAESGLPSHTPAATGSFNSVGSAIATTPAGAAVRKSGP
jgi:hypothetical protein